MLKHIITYKSHTKKEETESSITTDTEVKNDYNLWYIREGTSL